MLLAPSRPSSLRPWLVTLATFAATAACGPRARLAEPPDPDIGPPWRESAASRCAVPRRGDRAAAGLVACAAPPREVRAWGPPPRDAPPVPECPVRVRVLGDGVVADTLSVLNAFDPLPWDECVPSEFIVGGRRVFRVDDGWLVAYAGSTRGELSWRSTDGLEKRVLSGARVVGFTRAPSGTVLALAVGRARLGKGGVLAIDRDARGAYSPRLVAVLPLEPSAVAFDDGGSLVGFAQGFVFRVDERGRLENVHYVARSVGRVASIAKGPSGVYYLGLECGILRLVPEPSESGFREEWWSARDGASGRWRPCVDG
ncbi:MAG: hypothetical protein KF764_21425 [Labilithrix sp.]|nr:hypothetical protein [Labilithrix sp.]